jgi:hypothetical protein
MLCGARPNQKIQPATPELRQGVVKQLRLLVDRHGGDDTAYKLEALNPENMLGNLVQSVIDLDLVNREAAVEQEEAAYLEAAREQAMAPLEGLGD